KATKTLAVKYVVRPMGVRNIAAAATQSRRHRVHHVVTRSATCQITIIACRRPDQVLTRSRRAATITPTRPRAAKPTSARLPGLALPAATSSKKPVPDNLVTVGLTVVGSTPTPVPPVVTVTTTLSVVAPGGSRVNVA